MSGIKNPQVRQRLLDITPFPTLKQIVNIRRSEKSPSKDSNALNSKVVIERVSNNKHGHQRKYNNVHLTKKDCSKGNSERQFKWMHEMWIHSR